MITTRRAALRGAAALALAAPLSGCGTLLYPERRGQRGGRIDPAVAILDGVGCLLFLIPGLIAFAVDFHQGTIYLPGTQASAGERGRAIAERRLEHRLDDAEMDRVWREVYGRARPFRNEELRTRQLAGAGEARRLLA